jgi:hypothetical protein
MQRSAVWNILNNSPLYSGGESVRARPGRSRKFPPVLRGDKGGFPLPFPYIQPGVACPTYKIEVEGPLA